MSAVTADRVKGEVEAAAMISGVETEVLVSDYLAGELGIQILNPRRGGGG